MSQPRVIVRREGGIGRLTLNRPEALHALTLDMCQAMTEALLAWRDDPAVEAVMIDHSGGRGFCAGADIRALAQDAAEGGGGLAAFFLTEYRLNVLLHRYPKTTVAVMDGITMGGGLGLAWPCRYRIATERTVLAMPEGAIGLFPDVGMGWRLPRLPGAAGLWFALTGARLGPADGLLAGLATDYLTSRKLETLKAAFTAAPTMLDEQLAELQGDAGEPPLGLVRDDVDQMFGRPSVEAIVAALARDGGPWAQAQLAALKAASPTTSKVAFRLLHGGAQLERLEDEMLIEYRLAVRIARSPDFREGVRARIVDKDGAPRWEPSSLEAVTEAQLDALFAPLPSGEDWTPLP